MLNPNRRDCRYPDKNLCGAGVAFKLVHALLATLGWPAEKLARVMKSFLKLVAIATVADVVPLVGENRVIVKHGLDGLNQSKNPGLRAILELSGLLNGRSPSARQVAFQIAPRINAAGRMDDAQNVIRMFLTDDPEQARGLASQLHSLNQERRDTEAEIVRLVLEECAGVPVTDDQTVLVFSGLNWHRGVVGIVASRLVERFYRPVFVLSEEDGQAQGSGRSIAPFHLLDALESMPDLFTRFGGHRQAAGVSLAAESVPEFRRRLNAYAGARLTPADFQPQLAIDATVSLRELTTGPAIAGAACHGAVRIRKSRADARDPGRRSSRSARGDEREAPARTSAPRRPQPVPEGLEFRRTRRGFRMNTPSTPRFRSKKTSTARTVDSLTGLPCCAMSGRQAKEIQACRRAKTRETDSFFPDCQIGRSLSAIIWLSIFIAVVSTTTVIKTGDSRSGLPCCAMFGPGRSHRCPQKLQTVFDPPRSRRCDPPDAIEQRRRKPRRASQSPQ